MQQYTDSALRTIGKQCSNKLPPASAIQAMFLYEMQRQSEVESLFRDQVFQLAQVQDDGTKHEGRLWKLEDEIESFKSSVTKQLAAREVEERLATSQVRFDVMQTNMKQQDARIEDHTTQISQMKTKEGITNERMQDLNKRLKEQLTMHESTEAENLSKVKQEGEKIEALTSALSLVVEKMKAMEANLETTKTEAQRCDGDIGVLFDERDALATQLLQASDRISKLEEIIHVLSSR